MLAILVSNFYTHHYMRYLYIITVILGVCVFAVYFDAMIVFLLSGFIPGINVTLPPSTMIAVMIASAALLFALLFRKNVFNYCLGLYDQLFDTQKEPATSTLAKKTSLPRRRYQEL